MSNEIHKANDRASDNTPGPNPEAQESNNVANNSYVTIPEVEPGMVHVSIAYQYCPILA